MIDLSISKTSGKIFACVMLAAIVRSAPAAAQHWSTRTETQPAGEALFADRYEFLANRGGPPLAQPLLFAIIPESEPNDQVTQANFIALGDTVSGTIDPLGDIDYFSLDITAGTILDFDVDAAIAGTGLNPIIALVDTDSTIILGISDDVDGADPRILYPLATAGRYIIGVAGAGNNSTGAYTFRVSSGALTEVEPNDTPTEANLVVLGDTAIGVISQSLDLDVFALDVAQPALLELDVDAVVMGTPIDAFLRLLDVDGTTELVSNDNFGGVDSRIEYFVTAPGRYFIEIGDANGIGSSAHLYTIRFDTIQTGSGDPSSLFATGLGAPWGMAADGSGNLWVADRLQDRLVRVDQGGGLATIAFDIGSVLDVALDGFGNLLVTSFISNRGRIWRITPDGSRSIFSDVPTFPGVITVGSDGDVWVADPTDQVIRRFSPLGTPKDSLDVSSLGFPIFDLAFSPAGDLHLTTGFDVVYRVAGGVPEVVLTTDFVVEGIAFDQDGSLYVANGFRRKLLHFDPNYQLIEDPFARSNLGGPINIVFGRDATGAMTSRLLAANIGFGLQPPFVGSIVVVNEAGVPAPGHRVGVDFLVMSPEQLPNASVGFTYEVTLAAANPPGPVSWTVIEGALPAGLMLDEATGVLAGVPESAGVFGFDVKGVSGNRLAFARYLLTVENPSVAVNVAVDALLGVPGALTSELERFLDLRGNQNGFLDVGDLRALMREQNVLQASRMRAESAESR